MKCIVKHAIPVILVKHVMHVFCSLICHSYIFWTTWHKLNWPAGRHKHSHQTGLNCANYISNFGANTLASAIFIANVHLTIKVALCLYSVLRNLAFNKVNSLCNSILQDCFYLAFSFFLWLHVIAPLALLPAIQAKFLFLYQ